MLSRQVRLPLQTGSAAASNVLISLLFGIPFVLSVGLWGRHFGPEWILAAVFITFFGGLTYLILKGASSRQASDALLDGQGLKIESGPANGLAVPWSDVEPDASKIDLLTDPKHPEQPSHLAEMYLFRHSAEAVQLASSAESDERESMEALLACIRASCSGQAPPVRRREAEVLACPNCGAVAAPADQAVVACHFCAGPVTVPEDVRARIRASRDVVATPDAALAERLIAQPGAKRVNAVLRIGVVVFYVAAPIALIARAEIGAVVAAAALFVCVAIARAFIADRVALRALVLGFGAHAPSQEGAPETCRVCSAPLPAIDRADQSLLRCPFCNAVNLSGVDLRADAAVARSAEVELRSALAHRTQKRTSAYLGLLACVAILGAVCAVAYTFTMRRF